MAKKSLSLEDFVQIANASVRKAQEKHRKLNIPNVYTINGKLMYEYNGKLNEKPPKDWSKSL